MYMSNIRLKSDVNRALKMQWILSLKRMKGAIDLHLIGVRLKGVDVAIISRGSQMSQN